MKRAIKISLIILCACVPLIGLLVVCFGLPVYSHTYYAALEKQYDRLNCVNEPKVVLVGGSNVAFGIDCELFNTLYGKPIVPMGLYGVFGTQTMLELAKSNLNRGDTVIISCELTADSYSIGVNGEALLKATEKRFDILADAGINNAGTVFNSLISFALSKREYIKTDVLPQNDDVYKYDSVNEYGEITKGLRAGNKMRLGYLTEPLLKDEKEIGSGFIEYINEYVSYCKLRGVSVLFGFSPLNARAAEKQNVTKDVLYDLYDYLSQQLNCKVFSDPARYVYDYRYFYDTNFHLNDSGVAIRTAQLVRDLNLYEGNNKMVDVSLPDCPEPIVNVTDIDFSLQYTDSSLFEYEEENGFLTIIGAKDAAADLTNIVLPVMHEDKYVIRVDNNALIKCKNLVEITIPVGISELSDGCFNGCGNLKEIKILENKGGNITVHDGTFNGVNAGCRIILVNGKKAEFALDYFWGRVTLPVIEESK